MKSVGMGLTALGIWLAAGLGAAWAQDVAPAAAEAAAEAPAVSPEMFTTNNLWMMVATFLVFGSVALVVTAELINDWRLVVAVVLGFAAAALLFLNVRELLRD